ncbi:hypothetical protein EDD93_2588 [Streptomyces sp. 840.1]|uniref:DUF5955 family protein n=1 Tax=Streptomyces sp. 840.1 TaxID=2485152 RepID=UPI000F471200|nr:DUF5955 family protein [Streptomyces sp. 840.1]ROQ68132.1 hypothetical protein EDD93_2588 [Streptomyces sp. 840.1]
MSGDNVNMYGGTGNTGIQNNHFAQPAAGPASPELRAAVGELLRLVGELRGKLPPAGARALDDNLPALTGQADAPEERHRALLAVAGIAATVSTVGEPVVEAVRKVLGLLGAV